MSALASSNAIYGITYFLTADMLLYRNMAVLFISHLALPYSPNLTYI